MPPPNWLCVQILYRYGWSWAMWMLVAREKEDLMSDDDDRVDQHDVCVVDAEDLVGLEGEIDCLCVEDNCAKSVDQKPE